MIHDVEHIACHVVFHIEVIALIELADGDGHLARASGLDGWCYLKLKGLALLVGEVTIDVSGIYLVDAIDAGLHVETGDGLHTEVPHLAGDGHLALVDDVIFGCVDRYQPQVQFGKVVTIDETFHTEHTLIGAVGPLAVAMLQEERVGSGGQEYRHALVDGRLVVGESDVQSLGVGAVEWQWRVELDLVPTLHNVGFGNASLGKVGPVELVAQPHTHGVDTDFLCQAGTDGANLIAFVHIDVAGRQPDGPAYPDVFFGRAELPMRGGAHFAIAVAYVQS